MKKLKISYLKRSNFKQNYIQQKSNSSYYLINHTCFNLEKNKNTLFCSLNKASNDNDPITEDNLNSTAKKPAPSIVSAGHEANIFMIDDEATCLMNMEMILMSTPYTLITSDNSKTAFEYIKNNHDIIDLILLDLNMPEVNGIELLESIRNHELLAKIPVIIWSGCINQDYIKKANLLGISCFIPKPYKKELLMQAILKALEEI